MERVGLPAKTNVFFKERGVDNTKMKHLAYPKSPNNLPIPTTIDLRSARSIRFELGVLPFDQSISEILSQMPLGNGVNGDERIVEGPYRGKTLIEVQKLLSSKSRKLD